MPAHLFTPPESDLRLRAPNGSGTQVAAATKLNQCPRPAHFPHLSPLLKCGSEGYGSTIWGGTAPRSDLAICSPGLSVSRAAIQPAPSGYDATIKEGQPMLRSSSSERLGVSDYCFFWKGGSGQAIYPSHAMESSEAPLLAAAWTARSCRFSQTFPQPARLPRRLSACVFARGQLPETRA